MSATLDNKFYNLNIERAILSSILYAPQDLEEIVSNGLDEEYFYLAFHKDIYKTILQLQQTNMPIDEQFIRQKYNGVSFDDDNFFEIVSTTPLPNTTPYIAEIANLAENRRVEKLCREMLQMLNTSGDAEAVKAHLTASIDEGCINLDAEMRSFSEIKADLKKQPPIEKIKTGLAFIDQHIGGLSLGSLNTVGGEANSGKTSLVVQIMEHVSKTEIVDFFSLEFLLQDIIDKKGGVDGTYENHNWHLNNETDELEGICRTIGKRSRKGVRLFVIDSQMAIVVKTARNREEEETLKFAMLAKTAQKYGVVIILIHQTGDGQNVTYSKAAKYWAKNMIIVDAPEPKYTEYAKEAMPLTSQGQPQYDYRQLRYIKCKTNMEINWLHRFRRSTQTFVARLNATKVQLAIKQWEKEKKEAEKNGRGYVAPRLSASQLQDEVDGFTKQSGDVSYEEITFSHIKL